MRRGPCKFEFMSPAQADSTARKVVEFRKKKTIFSQYLGGDK
jgi:hypothetical protein